VTCTGIYLPGLQYDSVFCLDSPYYTVMPEVSLPHGSGCEKTKLIGFRLDCNFDKQSYSCSIGAVVAVIVW
jgi:hypothetical protein